jgi:hypothetical protein
MHCQKNYIHETISIGKKRKAWLWSKGKPRSCFKEVTPGSSEEKKTDYTLHIFRLQQDKLTLSK